MTNQKFVAFVDILGFKEMVKASKDGASDTIKDFSKIIYDNWEIRGYEKEEEINGFIVSDCAIIHTKDDSAEQLDILFKLISDIFQDAIFKKGFLLRCAITKGPFDELPSHGFENLSKKLIVGKAYVDATVLESRFKGANIVFGQDVYDVIPEIANSDYTVHKLSKESDIDGFYSLQWANIMTFMRHENLSTFIDLANKSKWLPHYYETIHLFLKGISNSGQKEDVWNEIFEQILKKEKEKASNYRDIDTFIINAFSQEIGWNFKRMMAKFLRDRVKSLYDKEEEICQPTQKKSVLKL